MNTFLIKVLCVYVCVCVCVYMHFTIYTLHSTNTDCGRHSWLDQNS